MSLLARLGALLAPSPGEDAGGRSRTLTQIVSQLEHDDPRRAGFVAAFAVVLARIAAVDLEIDEQERVEMERRVAEIGQLSAPESQVVVELARSKAIARAGTDGYLATREFRELSNREERARLVDALFSVAAADGGISSLESDTVLAVAQELGFSRPEALGMRVPWRAHLDTLKDVPGTS